MKLAVVLATTLALVLGGCATIQLPAACQTLLTPIELDNGWGQVPQYPGIVAMTMEDAMRVVERVFKGDECAKAAKEAIGWK
jgi:hypothetical protein